MKKLALASKLISEAARGLPTLKRSSNGVSHLFRSILNWLSNFEASIQEGVFIVAFYMKLEEFKKDMGSVRS